LRGHELGISHLLVLLSVINDQKKVVITAAAKSSSCHELTKNNPQVNAIIQMVGEDIF
jgi:hypothetical protein